MKFILCSIYDVVAKTSSDLQKFPNEASAVRATKEQLVKMPHPEDFWLVKNANVEIFADGNMSVSGTPSELLFDGKDLVKVNDESPK